MFLTLYIKSVDASLCDFHIGNLPFYSYTMSLWPEIRAQQIQIYILNNK